MSTLEKENVVVIASSTGGPKSLQNVVPKLPANLNAAVIIVQHMPAGFTNSLACRLNDLSEIAVKEAEEGEYIEKGTVYIAKGGKHLTLKQDRNRSIQIEFNEKPPREGVRPCANYTYESLINMSLNKIICVVMTGMGCDGTEGIENLKKSQCIFTIAQDEESSVIYGMPKVVTEKKLVDEITSLDNIAKDITKIVGVF